MLEFSSEVQVILVLGLCIILSFFANIITRKLKLPSIIAPLLIGLILNFWLLEYLPFLTEFKQILAIFANFGLIVILFFIGLKVDFRFFKGLSGNSSIMALNAGIIPLILGFYTGYFFTHDIIKSLFIGIALAITAEEVSITILDELNLLKKRIGQLIIEAGIIGDIFEISAIVLLGVLIKAKSFNESFGIFNVIGELALFISLVVVMRYFIIEFLLKIPGKDGKKYEYFAVAFVILLIMTIASELLNFSYIIGALVAGLLLKDRLIDKKMYYEEHHIVEAIEVFNFGVFESLVFIWIGLSINETILFSNIGLGIALTIIALAGKLIGSVIGNYFCNEPLSEGILIGWGLNARGATELFTVLIAKNQGIISQDIFSAVVFMALVTTIISPIVFNYLVLKGYGVVKHKVKK